MSGIVYLMLTVGLCELVSVYRKNTEKVQARDGATRWGGGGGRWDICKMCLWWYSARTSSMLYEPGREPRPVVIDR